MKNSIVRHKAIIALLVLFVLRAALPQNASAQEKLAILNIFETYQSEKGITTLEASEAIMKEYGISHFKSIIFNDGRKALPAIRKAMEQDKKNALKIKEGFTDGSLSSGYYRLATPNQALNRYLIFKMGKENKVTLLYIEGKLSPDELTELLK
ncbi:MAG: hypothetical protein LBU51_01705 [Bacteroidales bacterium]|jgi:hypothetical protein|nr:hypothetical protein [Bacteroidales bacterium]